MDNKIKGLLADIVIIDDCLNDEIERESKDYKNRVCKYWNSFSKILLQKDKNGEKNNKK